MNKLILSLMQQAILKREQKLALKRENNKHLVMMNVEADVTIGAYLKHEAEKRGLIYTLGAGDEPTSCMELIEFVSALGHKIVAAGKGKIILYSLMPHLMFMKKKHDGVI